MVEEEEEENEKEGASKEGEGDEDEVSEVKADRYSRTDQVAEARAVASALGPGTLPWVGSLEPVRLVSVFASIVPSFENLRQPVLLPLAFFPGSQLPASFARHPFSVFSPPIRVFLRPYLSPLPPPRSLHFFFPLPFRLPFPSSPAFLLFLFPPRPRQNPLRYRVSGAHPPPPPSTPLEQIDTGQKGKVFAVFLLVSTRLESRNNF